MTDNEREEAIGRRLTPRQRTVYALRNDGHDRKFSEIAGIMGISERTVYNEWAIIQRVIKEIAEAEQEPYISEDRKTSRKEETNEILRLSEMTLEYRPGIVPDHVLRDVMMNDRRNGRPSRNWGNWRKKQRQNGTQTDTA